jgi:NAD(P)H-hydrate epimerase
MKIYSPQNKQIVMTAKQVRNFDSFAINDLKIPGVVLMENAGRSCAELIIEKLAGKENPKVTIFCGTGNNGGDGFVIARHLLNANFKVTVAICGDPQKIKGDAKVNLQILENIRQPIEILNPQISDIAAQVGRLSQNADMLVDAIFGTGLSGNLNPDHIRLIEALNAQNRKVLAIDIPSGLNCDSGLPQPAAIKADFTVTFVAVKKGFANPLAVAHTGQIFIASIGIEPSEPNS